MSIEGMDRGMIATESRASTVSELIKSAFQKSNSIEELSELIATAVRGNIKTATLEKQIPEKIIDGGMVAELNRINSRLRNAIHKLENVWGQVRSDEPPLQER